MQHPAVCTWQGVGTGAHALGVAGATPCLRVFSEDAHYTLPGETHDWT